MAFMKLPQVWHTVVKMHELRRNELLSRAQLEARQTRKFHRLAAHVSRHSPYYAQIIKERGIDPASCKPDDFPVLTKSALLANFDRIATDRRISTQAIADFLGRSTDPNELFLDEYQVVHTSGSSGEVGYFVFSQAHWGRAIAQGARLKAPPPPFKRKRVAFFGAAGGHFGGVSVASTGCRGLNKYLFDIAIYEINSPLPRIIEQLNAFQPEVLVGYTAALKILADKQREGVLRIAPETIDATGEPVSEADKAQLKQAFGSAVYNMYACTEHLVMGIGKPGESNMVLYDDDLIFELHDDHTLVTNLLNTTLPLIRYRMSDVLRPLPNQPGGSPYREIESLVGRVEFVPAFVNREGREDFISPHTINEIFVPGVSRFQMQLLDKTSFRFMICLNAALSPQDQAAAVAGMEQKLAAILRACYELKQGARSSEKGGSARRGAPPGPAPCKRTRRPPTTQRCALLARTLRAAPGTLLELITGSKQKMLDNISFEVMVTDDLPVDPKTRKFRLIRDLSKKS